MDQKTPLFWQYSHDGEAGVTDSSATRNNESTFRSHGIVMAGLVRLVPAIPIMKMQCLRIEIAGTSPAMTSVSASISPEHALASPEPPAFRQYEDKRLFIKEKSELPSKQFRHRRN